MNEPVDLTTNDGLRLHARLWHPEATADATVLIAHGFGEHSGRYRHVIERLNAAGFAVLAYDMRGHGLSEGPKGHYVRFDHLVEDFRRAVAAAPDPVFVWAHSFGAQLALRSAIDHELPVRGLFLSAPWLRLAFEPPRWRVVLAGVMSLVYPQFTQTTTLNAERLSRDLDFLQSMPNPELAHRRISARAYFECVRSGEHVLSQAARFNLPFLMAQGTDDPVTSLAVNEVFFQMCSSTDKNFLTIPDARHELHNELDRETLIHTVIEWMQARLS